MASSAPKPVRATSAPRPGRPALALAVAGALLGLPLMSACGPSTGSSDGAATPHARGGTATAKGTDGTGGSGSNGGSGGTSWALSAPRTVAGHPQGQPPADMVRRFDDDTHKNAARLGVSGTPVRAYYDDRTDGAWILYTGVTGSGFEPGRLHDILDRLPAVHDDGAGDRTTTSAIDADPGPHGGRAICDTVLLRTELLATAVSTCSWFTPTTAAGITLIPKTDGTGTKLGFTAAEVAPIMRAVRAEVEVPRR
ncbi:hypothetical protein GCM10010433_11280 [Streptomyces pulveraceus]|uniref:Lipoprotein n=1 Tax=Streptomyces pulveraceus TaxID=68258 RepID=A0ABW1GZ85_9ACTN